MPTTRGMGPSAVHRGDIGPCSYRKPRRARNPKKPLRTYREHCIEHAVGFGTKIVVDTQERLAPAATVDCYKKCVARCSELVRIFNLRGRESRRNGYATLMAK